MNSLGEMSLVTESAGKIQGSPNFGKTSQIVLDFSDLSYFVTKRLQFKSKYQILRGISGSFRSGELTAILGSSGAGKSTLLNILTGYITTDVIGSIKLNDRSCQMSTFRKLSSYIMQDSVIQSFLTVEESLYIAANLKLGKEISENQKIETVNRILETLGLKKHRKTRTERLSGGQKKRLSIALELVSNPPVIFLDEPTTGLDGVATIHVIEALRNLAKEGRAVIFTIHQPSATICQYFDHMYFMTQGMCIYQGCFQKLVPFLSSIGHECPSTYNPADFILEVIQGDPKTVNAMSQVVRNGKSSFGSRQEGIPKRVKNQPNFPLPLTSGSDDLKFPVSFFKQVSVLLERKIKQQRRDMVALMIMIVHHIFTGVILGVLFQKVGHDANRPFDNFKFLISVVVFFMYTHVMCPVLLFPLEIKIMRMEYFNRWYSLKAYSAALAISTLHFHVILGPIFVVICYVLSDQPLDLNRILLFITIGFLLGVTSEGWGLTIGSLFNSRNGSIVGPASIVPLLAVSVYGMGYGEEIEPLQHFLMKLSYLRYGVVGFATSVYGENRTLTCDYDANVYCHYLDSNLLLKDLGMKGCTTTSQAAALFVFLVLHRLTAFLALKYRLSFNFSSKLKKFITEVFLRRKKWSF